MWLEQNFQARNLLEPRRLAFLAIVGAPFSVFIAGQGIATIPVGPIYVLDVILGLCFMGGFLALARVPLRNFEKSSLKLFALLTLIPFYALARLLGGGGDLSGESLRDFHPFLVLSYASLVVLLMSTKIPWKHEGVMPALIFALTIHWVFAISRLLLEFLGNPVGLAPPSALLSGPQISGVFLGILSSLLLIVVSKVTLRWQILLALVALLLQFQIFQMANRASFLASCVMMTTVLMVFLLQTHLKREKSMALPAFLAAICVLVPVLAASFSSAGAEFRGGASYIVNALERGMPSGLDSIPSGSDSIPSGSDSIPSGSDSIPSGSGPPPPSVADEGQSSVKGSGTIRARLDSWSAIFAWQFKDVTLVLFGAGFGSDYFVDSGGREQLMGKGKIVEGENRWPHNALVTVSATLGFPVMVFLFALISIAFFRLFFRSVWGGDELSLAAAVTLAGVAVASLFGVIFENPWGSILIAWAMGIAYSNPTGSLRKLETASGSR